MDSSTPLDYALFQLTPTRTRCDLVIFAGNANEKLASGLLQPFLTHLSFAKDQILKGGYSIALRSEPHASWFTKSTLARFVRFISTPEVVERFVTIESEIAQIENSIQLKEQRTVPTESERNMPAIENTNNVSYFSKSKVEPKGTNVALPEENSKVHLHRVLETRKAVLRKEQAMVYARALVAGFEMNYLNDLICFADAFGSPRLKEACINFMDLCKKKNSDRVWRDEVAAMQAFSRSEFSYLGASEITLSGEGNSLPTSNPIQSTDRSAEIPPSWANHIPQYTQHFQGPMLPKFSPYQGHLFPGMQGPPYYHPTMAWPPNIEDPGLGLYGDPNRHNIKSFPRSKEKSSHGKGPHTSKQDSNDDESDFSSSSDSDKYGEDGKKNSSVDKPRKLRQVKSSSRKVVIRNINYISSKIDGAQEIGSKGDSTEDDGSTNGYSLKQQVEEAVGSLEIHHKSTSHSKKKRDWSKQISNAIGSNGLTNQDLETDSFAMTHRSSYGEGENCAENFETDNSVHSVIKRESTYEEELFTHRAEESKNSSRVIFSESAIESSTIRSQKEGDWFLESRPDKLANISNGNSTTTFVEGHFQSGRNTKDVFVDDSLVFQSREYNESSDPQQRTDIFTAPDIVGAEEVIRNRPQELPERVMATSVYEPDDLHMVLERDSAADPAMAAWNPEMDSGNNVNTGEAVTRHSDVEPSDFVDMKLSPHNKGTRGRANGSYEGKGLNKEARSKALVGSFVKSKSEILSRSKNSSGTKSMVHKSKSEMEDEKRKKMEVLLIQRQKRIAERSGSSGSTPALSKTALKYSKTNVASAKNDKLKLHDSSEDSKTPKKLILRSSTIDRLAAARITHKLLPTESKLDPKKSSLKKVNSLGKKLNPKKSSGLPSSLSNTIGATSSLLAELSISHETPSYVDIGYPENIKDSFDIPSVEKNDIFAPQKETLSSFPSAKLNPLEVDDTKYCLGEEDAGETKILPVSPEITVIDNFTPPSGNEMSPEPTHSRRKWDLSENTPKLAKGFRKLLLFGRKA